MANKSIDENLDCVIQSHWKKIGLRRKQKEISNDYWFCTRWVIVDMLLCYWNFHNKQISKENRGKDWLIHHES